MYALNELKRLITDVSRIAAHAHTSFPYQHGAAQAHADEWLTPAILVAWIIDNDVLPLVFKCVGGGRIQASRN